MSTLEYCETIAKHDKPSLKNVHSCKLCDFKTELTALFKEHIGKYHGIQRELKDDLLSEDFRIQNYVCEKCNFETNLS